MFKVLVFVVLIACSAAGPIATPLLGKLVPQPAQAPAHTEHAGYVGAYTPILRPTAYVATAPIIPATYEFAAPYDRLPYVYAGNYLTYSAPIIV